MDNNIPEIAPSRKTMDIVLVLIIALLGVFSFGLGRLSGSPIIRPPVALCGESIQNNSQSGALTEEIQGTYVASKNGSVYHFPWCSGAQRISEENKIWFPTKSDAEAAGYRPAANCKGL